MKCTVVKENTINETLRIISQYISYKLKSIYIISDLFEDAVFDSEYIPPSPMDSISDSGKLDMM